jgi:hypothetical protein
MSENAYTQAEAALVDKIAREVIADIKHRTICGVVNYANEDDWQAAAQAVIQLVKERLNNQAAKGNL